MHGNGRTGAVRGHVGWSPCDASGCVLRIQVLTHTYPRFPGDTNGPFVEDLCEAHARAGHEVHVLTSFDPHIDDHRGDRRVTLGTYRYAPTGRMHVLAYSRTLQGDTRMRTTAKLLGPALVASATTALYQQVRRFRPDVLHAHWIVPGGFAAAVVSRLTGVPLFLTLHGSDVFVAGRNALFRRMAVYAATTARAITSCSPDLTASLSKLGARVDHVQHVPNGCDPEVFRPSPEGRARLRTQLGIPQAAPLVLSLGRFAHKKGFDVLLRAAPSLLQRVPGARVVIAGGGDLESELRGLHAELGLDDRVTLLGSVDRSRIADYFSACDVFAVPSVRDAAGNVDGLPVVVLEAMATGVPVVASNLTGIPLAVRHGDTGLLVPPGDPDALGDALVALLGDTARARRLGHAGRARVEQELSWNAVAARHRALYTQEGTP